MNDEICVVVYKKVHGEKVVAIAVSQTSGGATRIHTLVCRVHCEFDAIQAELNRNKRGRQIIESVVPEAYFVSATCTMPPLPPSDSSQANIDERELWINSWVQQSGLRVVEIATTAIAQANALPPLGVKPILPMSETLIAETLIAGTFGAWGAPFIAVGNKLTRNLEERRPLVRALERLLPLVGLQNNIRIYAEAFGYGTEKAHKDVRTYRETVKRWGWERIG